ncbi:Uncharacterised protein [Mycobacteroides abscessus subsp. abscessus]|nr:Uncharacterised protein [Mycobacteroides abscessus subsp. abscessus]
MVDPFHEYGLTVHRGPHNVDIDSCQTQSVVRKSKEATCRLWAGDCGDGPLNPLAAGGE